MASKKQKKYEAILKAALKVFAENGLDGTQISKIAREANVADGTIYLYFKNKEEIFVSIFREGLSQLVEKLNVRIREAKNAEEALRELCHVHFADLEQNVHLTYVNQFELRQSSAELRNTIAQWVGPYFQLIEDILQKGIEEGTFRANLNVKLARRLIFGGMDQVVSAWLSSGQKYSLTAQAEETVEFFLRGLKKETNTKWGRNES